MSATPSLGTDAPRGVRPSKPPPPPFALWGGIGFVLLTIGFSWDWTYGIGFSIPDLISNFTLDPARNPIVAGVIDPVWETMTRPAVIEGFIETFQLAAIATILGGIVGLPLALLNSLTGAPNKTVYILVKNFNSFIRAIPDLIYAVFFVAAIGRGALPGVLALFFLSVAVIAKLTADIVDGIDQGPIESARASGASHVQMVKTAVIPQILPGYTSFALYTFEINLRGSAVLGFVGAGGIGTIFSNYYQRGWYDRLVVVVIGFFIVVFIVDRISIAVRKRLL
ncbi:MAG: ABC transporter permease subunit [Nitriliruptoraceae bacterium]|nr:ABC transporter permease subunit [Nitriliruptoraceae bacterium]